MNGIVAPPSLTKDKLGARGYSAIGRLAFRFYRQDRRFGDRFFFIFLKINALAVVAVLFLMAFFLAFRGWSSIRQFGFSFLTRTQWDVVNGVYGALPFVYGTLVSSLIAMVLAVPVSVGIALFLNELAHPKVAAGIGFLVEMLAAIPSVVYGLWGIYVLAPFLRTEVEPFLKKYFGYLPLFEGPAYGVGMLAAGIILAVMVIPTISTITREVFRAIPRINREAAIALGATRWETMRLSVLKTARTGILGAVILGLGRALGETMAVTMVIGNRAEISASLFAPSQTMASVIANEYAEATEAIHLSALAEVGLVLFVVTFLVNLIARAIVWRFKV